MTEGERRHAELLSRLDRQIELLRALHRRLWTVEAIALVLAIAWIWRAFV